ncbi:MAG: hypothetical protein KDD99_14315 [Bacteroidetes bacterium]|nr:hypothetical protein [Bacteroidota bacterium]
MAKQKNKTNNYQALTLIIGPWKKYIPDYRRKILISEVLNQLVYHENLKIKGYLITKRRVCLILDIEKEHLNHLLKVLYKKVEESAREYIHQSLHPCRLGLWEERPEEEEYESQRLKVFKRCAFTNFFLIDLLLGKKVELGYYNPHVARLKDMVRNYPYCSAGDYRGEMGPVVVAV